METIQSGAEHHRQQFEQSQETREQSPDFFFFFFFAEESTASPSADRVKDVRTQTRVVLRNTYYSAGLTQA